MKGRKSYEVVGYVGDAVLLCPDCAGELQDTGQPVFLDQCQSTDYCDGCLNDWMRRTPRSAKPPAWVYLDGVGPEEE